MSTSGQASGRTTEPASTRTRLGTWARGWHGITALVVVVAVVTQLRITAFDPSDPTVPAVTRFIRFFSYFTIQSNLLVVASVLPLVLRPAYDGRLWRLVRLDALLGIVVTGLVYATVLAGTVPLSGGALFADFLFHRVSPALALIGWLVFGPRPRVEVRTVALSMIWPLTWVAYTLVHGAVSNWYPYPFIDVSDLGYGRVMLNVVFVTILFLALATAASWYDRRVRPTV